MSQTTDNRQHDSRHTQVMLEIPPLSDQEFMYVADRHKAEFSYPLHQHAVAELNYVEGGRGLQRVVGDSSETCDDYDLVLIASPHLEHVWEQGTCTNQNVREITIQFWLDVNEERLMQRTPMSSIRRMLQAAQCGLAFPMPAIMQVYPLLDGLTRQQEDFYVVHDFFAVLYELSKCQEARQLATSSYAKVPAGSDSRRVLKVKEYIDAHYTDDLRLADMASLVGMTDTSFSRFFHQHTGKTLADYIIDFRLGRASRLLVETNHTVSEICYECGFNTLTNFNRLFRKRKNCSPTEFRDTYRKKRIVI